MDGPERLEAGPPGPTASSARTRWALVLALAVALAVVLVARPDVLGLSRSAPTPSTGPPGSGGTTPAGDPDEVPARAWPAGVSPGRGTLYLTASREVLAVDASTGLVTDTGLAVEGYDVRLTALSDGVLVWYPSGRGSRLLRFGLDTGRPLVGGLERANRFLPAPAYGVWAARVESDRPRDRARWSLLDGDAGVETTVPVPGRAVGDGAGGLLSVADGRVRPVHPRTGPPDDGAVVATGPDGYLVQRCLQGTCTTVLRDRASGSRQVLAAPVAGSAVDGALSPGNRTVLLSQLEADAPVVQVRPLASDRPLRTFPGAGSNAVWLSERWVAFLGRDGLVLYDAVDDVVVDSGLGGVTRLAWRAG